METYPCLLLIGLICLLYSNVASQHLSYGEKMISLSRLPNSLEKTQSSQNELVMALDELMGSWEKTLLWFARNGQQYSVSQYNVSTTCMQHLNLTVSHLEEQWAQRMIDSLPKLPSGFFNGNLQWMGAYDECVNETAVVYLGPNSTNPTHPFKGQYCRVGIPLAPLPPMFIDIGAMDFLPGELVVGLCVPSTCSEQDVFNLINAALSFIPPISNNFTIQAQKAACQKDVLEYDAKAIGVIILFSILFALIIVGTIYDVFIVHKLHLDPEKPLNKNPGGGLLQDDPPENESSNIKYRIPRVNEQTPLLAGRSDKSIQDPEEQGLTGKLLLAFSLYTNGSKLLSTTQQPGTLGALNGVRFFSMSWVILGHSFGFAALIGTNVGSFVLEVQTRFTFMAILNATVAVDSFFLISGLLVAYLTLKELHRLGGVKKFKWGLFYFHRFWRLTPPYMLVIALYVPLLRYLYNGPLWPQTSLERNFCEDTWWKNFLYINNFFKSVNTDITVYHNLFITLLLGSMLAIQNSVLLCWGNKCMAWSWYLANDMQFYVISPVFLISLYYSRLLGVTVCFAFLLMSCIVSGTLSSVNNYPIGIFGGGGDLAQMEPYFDNYYVRPYCRIGAYMVGMIVGYVLYSTDCKVKMRKSVNLFGWLLAAVCCLSVLYGPYGSYSGKAVAGRDMVALYTALNRPVWALGVGWVIFACATGHGGIINWFLSWKLFIPLSRLTYLSYLIHPVVLEVYYQGQRNGLHLNDFNLSYLFVAHLVVTNVVALVLSLAFESPFMGLEKAIFKRERRH